MTRLAGRTIVKPYAWVPTEGAKAGAAWRSQRPRLDLAKCTGCLICWKYCPEPAITPQDGKVAISTGACKGCGICATECPFGAITMEPEAA